jgi:hypothetical protein
MEEDSWKPEKKNKFVVPLGEFAKRLDFLQKSDRDSNLGVAGMTGEGKSNFIWQLLKEYCRVRGIRFLPEYLTWSRKELLQWIDGKKGSKPDAKTGLREGQVPEYSFLIPDELIILFYKRNWMEDGQIEAINTLNTCRDRHLIICGGVPVLWELDSAVLSRLRFYVFVKERGVAWLFQQESNPFSLDLWNRRMNEKFYRKMQNPYALPNFVCEFRFPDWSEKEKDWYYQIRNKKRVIAIQGRSDEKRDKYSDIKWQRDRLIKWLIDNNRKLLRECPELKRAKKIHKLTYKELSDLTGLSIEYLRSLWSS